MSVETDSASLFAQAIQEHLELKQRNSLLEREMPLDVYKSEDPFENHPLFKTEEQARLEETMDGQLRADELQPTIVLNWPVQESPAGEDSSLWSRSRDFDWGD
jgi:hypothetical protein